MTRLTLIALTALALGTAGAQTRTVNIGLGYFPNVQFTPFYVADKLGYFKAEGLTVKFQHGFINELMPLLLQGKLDFVVGDPEDAIFARNQGADVRYVMTMYQKNPVTVFSLSPLASAAALKGKTLGVPGPFGSSYNAVLALLDDAGLKDGRDLKLATVGFTQVDAVRGGRVDAAVGYVNNDVLNLARATGKKVYTLDVSGAYPMVGAGLIGSAKTLSGNLPGKVVRASQRGLKFTVADPARAFTLAQPVFGADGGTLEVLKASTPLMTSAWTQQNGLGSSNPAAWSKAVAALIQQGSLKEGAKAADYYTNQYISKTLK
ncbi:NitT/TauT family transport system substrate-binding protein [Deinococcus metalli]|uniref:NitT/TauT family transport system substrate-binding protein n=1 Tax=Deinococcus metalli TaxID=1141878 RepID=A0A7W8NQU0_9DEIO|nr:ABC transporter substrate-binding protein [Deinococcus metalli]MBB5376203.1 NitT/TauT family transport system substrate-binding protein [Deinococcus metalli]GHF40016.1 sulfonate ABC transporter substrate-binding protein [Deinococcus metalli]